MNRRVMPRDIVNRKRDRVRATVEGKYRMGMVQDENRHIKLAEWKYIVVAGR